MEETKQENMQETEAKVVKSFTVSYFEDGRIDVKSGSEQEMSTDEIYDHIYILKELIQENRISEAVAKASFNGSFRGAQKVFTDMAEMRMRQQNAEAAKASEGPTLENPNKQ